MDLPSLLMESVLPHLLMHEYNGSQDEHVRVKVHHCPVQVKPEELKLEESDSGIHCKRYHFVHLNATCISKQVLHCLPNHSVHILPLLVGEDGVIKGRMPHQHDIASVCTFVFPQGVQQIDESRPSSFGCNTTPNAWNIRLGQPRRVPCLQLSMPLLESTHMPLRSCLGNATADRFPSDSFMRPRDFCAALLPLGLIRDLLWSYRCRTLLPGIRLWLLLLVVLGCIWRGSQLCKSCGWQHLTRWS
mmetsp:Transcript_6722/g.14737  ORF Transcript_6722/g.14737 Transcript_6722/m.14737 type:complete len:245 (-) Transcript_6722:171-905(-)